MNNEIKDKTWWIVILYCLGLIAIFVCIAFVCDLVTDWIPDRSLKFFAREILLRLPLTLFLMYLFSKHIVKTDRRLLNVTYPKAITFKWVGIGIIISTFFIALTILLNETTILFKGNDLSKEWLTFYIVSSVSIAVNGAILEETLFRGYIMGLLLKKWNLKEAVIIPSVIFGVVHLTMIESFNLIDASLLLLRGTLVAIMFSLMTIKTKSTYSAVLVHFVWNLLVAGRILKISVSPIENIHSIFSIQLHNENVLLNGGKFGVEVSLIAIFTYTAVSLILLWLISKKGINPA